MLLVAYTLLIKRSNEKNLACQFGFGNNVKYYSIHDIAKSIWDEKCKAFPFLHGVSGCDTVSSIARPDSGILG